MEHKSFQGMILVDVRSLEEYEAGALPGSIRLDCFDIQEDTVRLLLPDRNAPIGVFCHTGSRSAPAVLRLRQLGYTQVTDLGGLPLPGAEEEEENGGMDKSSPME